MISSILRAELKKYLIELKIYYADHLVGMAITLMIFAAFALTNKASQASFYVGFVYWYLLSSLITESSTSISMEKQMGTLEQLLIKPVRFEVLIILKTLVWYGVNSLKVFLVLLILSLVIGLSVSFHWLMLPIFLLASAGIFGFTLVLVALTLKYTKTASFEAIISYLLLMLTGAVLPTESLPKPIQVLAESLPITKGIDLSRQLLDEGRIAMSELSLMGLQSALYFLVGYGLFLMIYQKSRYSGLERNY